MQKEVDTTIILKAAGYTNNHWVEETAKEHPKTKFYNVGVMTLKEFVNWYNPANNQYFVDNDGTTYYRMNNPTNKLIIVMEKDGEYSIYKPQSFKHSIIDNVLNQIDKWWNDKDNDKGVSSYEMEPV